MSDCIFVDKPKECLASCLASLKLKCLLNHRHLKVTKTGRTELVQLVKAEVKSPDRYKLVSGQAGRKNFKEET